MDMRTSEPTELRPAPPGASQELPEFPWHPRRYARLAVLLSLGIHAYLYLGMIGLVYLLNRQDWILGWKPLAVAVVSAVVFGRLAYSWIMRLDAQYGSGSGWRLVSRSVKLPEISIRERPRS